MQTSKVSLCPLWNEEGNFAYTSTTKTHQASANSYNRDHVTCFKQFTCKHTNERDEAMTKMPQSAAACVQRWPCAARDLMHSAGISATIQVVKKPVATWYFGHPRVMRSLPRKLETLHSLTCRRRIVTTPLMNEMMTSASIAGHGNLTERVAMSCNLGCHSWKPKFILVSPIKPY